MSDNFFDELFCKAVSNCENVTCIRCPMFSIKPLKNENHCLLSEIMKEAQRMKAEAEETKRIWHDIKEIPVIPNGDCQVRIALYERRPVELNSDLSFTIIESERIYREQDYNEKKWNLLIKENYVEKWCYWNELVSDSDYFNDIKTER